MNKINIKTNTLYILSGLSSSGKSTFTNKLKDLGYPADGIISSDEIRKSFLGAYDSLDEYGVRSSLVGWDLHSREVFDIIKQLIEIRLIENLPTLVDATCLSDLDRKFFIDIAEKLNVPSHVIIFEQPLDLIKERLSKRYERFDFSVVEPQNKKFERTSKYPFTVLTEGYELSLLPNLLDSKDYYIVGDTHGLLNELTPLLSRAGFSLKDGYFKADGNKKLLFLGDILDRGEQSIDLLRVIKKTVEQEQGSLILGNHENKLISSWFEYQKTEKIVFKSISSNETLLKFLQIDLNEQKELIKFLTGSPSSAVAWVSEEGQLTQDKSKVKFKIGFCHANNSYFNEMSFPKAYAMYGNIRHKGNLDVDKEYERNYIAGVNKHILIHGHTPEKSQQNHVYSLDKDQAFGGYLVCLNLNELIKKIKDNQFDCQYKFFEEAIMKEKVDFNFDDKIRNKMWLFKEMSRLQSLGLVTDGNRKDEHGNLVQNKDGFKIYKYSKSVHFKKLWKTEKLLSKARGLAIDSSGEIIVHPFDKLYNFGEYDTGKDLPLDTKVQAIEKLNGFLGCISKHPFRNELLVSTTGSISKDAPYVQFIYELITPEMNENLLNYFKTNKTTLMFEVLHPKDPHIIKYEESDFGLWLIGARSLDLNSKIYFEKDLDILGNKLNFRRPQWTVDTFDNILEMLKTLKTEGFMIRKDENDEPIMKIKSNYYLVTKFIGRMGGNMITMMYKNPEQFKKDKVDEEFYPVVDKIVKNINKDDFSAMNDLSKVNLVRNIVEELRDEFSSKSKSLNPKLS